VSLTQKQHKLYSLGKKEIVLLLLPGLVDEMMRSVLRTRTATHHLTSTKDSCFLGWQLSLEAEDRMKREAV